MRFVLATGNAHKVREVREILHGLPLEVVPMGEAGFAGEIEENGETFEENALIKARAVHAVTGGFVMADDSGLAVDALGGAPGIHSARYGGRDATYPEKIALLWDALRGVPEEARTARFVCAVAVVRPDGSSFTVRGTCEGRIAHEMRGEGGFGYDPVFLIPELGRTTAELDAAEKHAVSHRGRALRLMVDRLCEEGLHP
jgi:XTP/dITP diphosphohydrolase